MPGNSRRTFDAESLLRSLMDNVPGAIYRCSLDGIWKMQRVSEEIESIAGYPAVDFIDASKRTSTATRAPRTPASGSTAMLSRWRSRTTAAEAPTGRAAPVCAVSKTG